MTASGIFNSHKDRINSRPPIICGVLDASSVQFLLPQCSDLHVPLTLSFPNSSSCFLSSARSQRSYPYLWAEMVMAISFTSFIVFHFSLITVLTVSQCPKSPVSNIVQSSSYLWLCQFQVFNQGWNMISTFLLVALLRHWIISRKTNNLKTWKHEPF